MNKFTSVSVRKLVLCLGGGSGYLHLDCSGFCLSHSLQIHQDPDHDKIDTEDE